MAAPTIGERARLLATGWDVDLAHEIDEAPLAPPRAREAIVRVDACGVCHRDLLDRAGRFPFQRVPITPGHEAAGTVIAVGDGVRDVAVGDRVGSMHRDACGACDPCREGETSLCAQAAWVLGILADGGYARHLVAPASVFYRTPDDVTPTEAATLHCTFGTAYRDLVTLGKLRAGERVLVTGANGGVGCAAVQIAARLGAEVIAVVRRAEHDEALRALGASDVIVDRDGAFHERVPPIDLALDTVGQPTFLAALRALRVGGRVVVVGNIVPEKVGLNLGFVITRGLTIVGGSGANRREMDAIAALHRARPFTFPIARVLPLSRADEAQRLVREGGLRGRIVLVPT